jgi:hypothetical protein
MDPEPKDSSWRERLFHEDQEFPLTYTAVQPDQASAARAWEGTAHLDEFRALTESILEQERSEGTLLLLADPDDVPAARVYSAVCLARLLAERGQRVLIAQTHATEQAFLLDNEFEDVEGFVDLVLYGVSPAITCRPTRLPRIDVLALGSFRPEPGSVYPEDELRRAFGQLRASYDVILMMSTTRTGEGRVNPLLDHADGVVLVTAVQRPEELEAVRHHLRDIDVGVWGAVVFTSAAETVDLTVEGALEERRKSRPVVIDASPPLVIHDGRSSPFFRRFAVSVAVILLGFAAWWAWMQFFGGERSAGPAHEPVVADAGSGRAATNEAGLGSSSGPSQATTSSPEETATGEPTGASPEETAAPTPSGGATTTDTPALENTPAPADPAGEAETVDVSTDEPFEETVSPVTPPVDPQAARIARLTGFLKEKPGGGYGLYVWSFPDSLEAEGALQPLRRDGFQPIVVGADIEGRGRWYRVVVGNFTSRQDALDARDILTQRSDVDWAGLVHVN